MSITPSTSLPPTTSINLTNDFGNVKFVSFSCLRDQGNTVWSARH